MSTMKAVRIHTYGGSDILTYEDVPCPEAGANEALVRVIASGVNPFDWKVREGYLAGWFNHKLPLTLGWNISGVIQEVGPGVTDFSVGDEVFASMDVSQDGGYAEYVALPTAQLVAKPPAVDHQHAAAIPNSGLAAWQSLYNAANLQEGQTVLIHGAAGGVGHFAVQFAKLRGAKVIGTSSERNLDFLRELGVDEAIDYNATRFDDVVRDADVVLDTIGGEVLQRCWVVLKPGGILVSVVEAPSEETAAIHGVRQAFTSATAEDGLLAKIASMIVSGIVRPIVTSVFPLAEARQAQDLSQSLHSRGKIILQVAD